METKGDVLKKDLLKLIDLTEEDFGLFFDRALELKRRYRKGIIDRPMIGKTMGMIFDKPSTRTRISFEAGFAQLGGTPIFLNTADTQMGRSEPIKDTARVMSRYLDAIVIRTFSQALIEEFAKEASIPVVNALSDDYHPCQILSDLLTVIECKGGCKGLKYAWVGDGNNVAHSWINAAAVLGLDIVLACPEGYFPNKAILDRALSTGKGSIRIVTDPKDAVKDADVIYTDVWASMGMEKEQEKRLKAFAGYLVDKKLVDLAKKDVIVMHCLPAHRGEEISDEVMEGPNSVLWDQAENKMHMHKAIMDVLINR